MTINKYELEKLYIEIYSLDARLKTIEKVFLKSENKKPKLILYPLEVRCTPKLAVIVRVAFYLQKLTRHKIWILYNNKRDKLNRNDIKTIIEWNNEAFNCYLEDNNLTEYYQELKYQLDKRALDRYVTTHM